MNVGQTQPIFFRTKLTTVGTLGNRPRTVVVKWPSITLVGRKNCSYVSFACMVNMNACEHDRY